MAVDMNQLFDLSRGRGNGVLAGALGLAICRAIVQAHGGSIVAENREGGGACFRATLPLAGTPPEASPDPELP